MPDLFPDFTNFQRDLNGQLQPPAPAGLRREGDRRRRRTRVLVAGATAVIVAAVAIPLALRTGGPDRSGPQPVAPTTTSTTVSADPEALKALLPTASDFIEFGETSSPWRVDRTVTGTIPSELGSCGQGQIPMPTEGRQAMVTADYATTGESTPGFAALATVVDYADTEHAQDAWQKLQQVYAGCSASLTGAGRTHVSATQRSDVDLGPRAASGTTAETFFTTYDDPEDRAVTQVQHAVALNGDTLLVVAITQSVQDYWPDLADSAPAILGRFLDVRELPDHVLYDHQYRYLRLSESWSDATAAGYVDCGAQSDTTRKLCAAGDSAAVACASPKDGVQAIFLPPLTSTTPPTDDTGTGAGTGTGLSAGMTVADLQRIYPQAKQRDDGSWLVPTTNGVESSYLVDVDGTGDSAKVTSIILQMNNQQCYE